MKKRIYISLFAAFVLLFSFNRVLAQIKPETMRQIQSLMDEKASRTPAQRKMQSSLLQAAREHRGQKMAAGVDLQPAQVNADVSGGLDVEISCQVTEALLTKIRSLGGQIIYQSKEYKTITARVNLNDAEKIAAFPEVTFIQPAPVAELTGSGNPIQRFNKTNAKTAASYGLATTTTKRSIIERREKLKKQVQQYVMMLGTGTVNSEGDHGHRADDARNAFGYAGQGIKIGIMSDSYNNGGTAAANVLNGNLPGVGNPFGNTTPVTVLQDYISTTATDEGQAMVQIVHDLVPKAQLYFATANSTAANFATNIKLLRAAGCDVIIDDVSYSNEPAFQDGIIAQAVNFVTADGAMYFSSAGNSGSLLKGTSGVYEADFNSTGAPTFTGSTKTGGSIHNFGTGTLGDVITKAATGSYNLMWADPIGKSTNDYDLYLVSAAGVVKGTSNTTQSGSSDPYESIATATLVAGDQLVVFKAASAAVRAFALNSNRGTLTVATNGQTHGHASAVNAFCVAATPAAVSFGAGSPTGPYPGIFNASNQLETFSSDGPRRIFFNADSTPVTAGSFTFASNGFITRAKPDITAADGVSTSLSGFNPFFGTSAAAPHAGAIAALLKSAKPSLTAAQIRTILTTTALDIEGPGYENNSGFGIIQAYQAMQAVNPTPLANISLGTVTSTEGSFSNNNGIIEPGEVANVLVQLKNLTTAIGTNVTATLTTTTTGVNISNSIVNYGDLAGGASTINTTNPFKVGISSSVACGSTITFYLTVNFGGGNASPVGFTFNTAVGTTITLSSTSASLGSPVAGPNSTATTGQQIGRMSRITTGVTSTCAAPFANPGLTITTGARQYDAYTFTNTTGAAQCFTATITAANSLNNIYSTAYNSSGFIPATPNVNYIGEPAQTAPIYIYSFSVAAGAKFTVVISAVDSLSNPGGNEVGTGYTLGITYIGCSTPPACAPVVIGTSSIANGAIGNYYVQKITATGGSAGVYVDSLTGALPAGISFVGDSLYGTPTQAGTFPIAIKVASATGCSSATANYNLFIAGITPKSVITTAGTPQSVFISTDAATSFKVTVLDSASHTVSGVNVTFTAPTTGASGTFAGGLSTVTVVSDANGIATAPTFTANATTGTYTVTATVANVVTPANFNITNTCPSTLVISGGDTGPGTLRTIIANACAGSVITFDPSVTTVSLTSGEILISKALTINGNGANVTTVSAGNISRVFNITAGVTSVVNISGMTIRDGKVLATSSTGGGGVTINSGVVTLSTCVITNNSASLAVTSDGGGVYNATANTGLVKIDRCTITNNTTDRLGGGIASWGTGTMTITNSTIASNTASGAIGGLGYGGGLFFNTNVTATNCTIVNNTANLFGGNIQRNGTTAILTMGNTIIAGGVLTTTGQTTKDINGAFTSTGYNLLQNSTGATITGVTTGNLLNVNANLLPLANYGGALPTILPMSSSPAINAGSNALLPTATLDERGTARVVGTQDIGAVETNYTIALAAGTPQSTLINTAFAAPLQVKVTESSNNIAGDSVTFTAPATGASATFPSGTRLGSVVTNASGMAAIAATANGTVGTYNVVGSAGSVFTPLTYALTNTFIPLAFTTCPNVNLIISRPGYNNYNGEGVMMYNMDTTTGAASLIAGGPLKDSLTGRNIDVNGAGVNAQDGFVYAIRDTVNTAGSAAAPLFYRIGINYANTLLGNLPTPALTGGDNLALVIPAAGTFDGAGNYYYIAMSGTYASNAFTPTTYYIGKVANIASLAAGTSTLNASFTKINFDYIKCDSYKSLVGIFKTITSASGAGAGGSFQDITYSNQSKSLYTYAVYNTFGNTYVGQIIGINPVTGVAFCYNYITSPFGAANNEVAGISTTASGNLEVLMTSGDIYKATIVNVDPTFASNITKLGASGVPALGVTGSIRGDLASCNVGPASLPSSITPPSITIGLPNQIIAYPNPAQGITTITVGQSLTNATVRVLGSTGNVISELSGVSGLTFQIDMTGKAGGMYTVEVIQGGNVQVAKIIKP